jgi:Leucine-rich repeat (LRR) protein
MFNYRELILKRNKLESLPNDISELKELIKLDCSENYFSELPNKIFEFPRIE